MQAGEDAAHGRDPDLLPSHQPAQLVVGGEPDGLHERHGVGVGEEPGRLVGAGGAERLERYLRHTVTVTGFTVGGG